jgi:hypothetical protein
MPRALSDPLLKLIALDEAAALMAEFGAGAALFANGQVLEAQASGRCGVAAFWSAVLGAVEYPPSADDLERVIPAAPDRVAHRPWQDDAPMARRSGMRDAVAMNTKFTPAERLRSRIRH